VVRVTYDLRDNELRLAAWMGRKASELLRAMGASKTWEGPYFTGVGSSHEMGGCRFGTDPATSVLDPWCRAHDLDNLWVIDAGFFPSSAAMNPALTIAAQALRVVAESDLAS
jgi:gluconate 2-dehydrogenase alpha chain